LVLNTIFKAKSFTSCFQCLAHYTLAHISYVAKKMVEMSQSLPPCVIFLFMITMPSFFECCCTTTFIEHPHKVKFVGWKNFKFGLIAKVQTFIPFMLIRYGLQCFFSLPKFVYRPKQEWKKLGILLYLGFLSKHVVKI
jgi:hypothetical protein